MKENPITRRTMLRLGAAAAGSAALGYAGFQAIGKLVGGADAAFASAGPKALPMEKLMANWESSIRRDPRGGLAPHW